MKKLLGILALCALFSMLIVACGGSNGGGNTTGGGNTVGLAATTFAQGSITIKKGESITLTNQTGTVHIISNGSWNGNTPAPKVETGAPVMNNVTFSSNGQSQTVGPFTTAGTFHYYCTVHPGMNLTVTVQ
ncbi:MAG TPA: plastocyanin/azurin family copper-binding protein [Ktedonobacteraceae bacterium]|nr:plastocyanin/azurin family copper-binding protein [Ktedonobacteraceae bacterium]